MIQDIFDFFTGITKDSWRDVVISSLLIPLVFYLFTKLRTWLTSIKPLNLVLAGFRKSKKDILIFLSQLSGANNQNHQLQLTQNQLYLSRFPQPLPQNQTNLGIRTYQNIDPVWSQSDGQCAAEVFNLLGQINKHNGFRIADTLRDWNEHFSPIFSVGFNPKTHDLMNYCLPINFQLGANGSNLSISGHNLALNAAYPSDAGILQKTYMPNSKMPVFILAGLGTTGTEAAGKVLNENCTSFGKLYGRGSFCVLFKTDITRGSDYYEIKGIFPNPKLNRALWYPITFINWYLKKIYPTN
jgi:hypothetical protein